MASSLRNIFSRFPFSSDDRHRIYRPSSVPPTLDGSRPHRTQTSTVQPITNDLYLPTYNHGSAHRSRSSFEHRPSSSRGHRYSEGYGRPDDPTPPLSRSNSHYRTNPVSSSHVSSHPVSHLEPPVPPSRGSSSSSIASRPALKQSHSGNSTSSSDLEKRRRHVSFVNPKRPQTLHMHPLLASSHHTHAPISYDVTYAPSPRTVLDRTTTTAVPSHLLAEPATDPPMFSMLVLHCDFFPWPVVVRPRNVPPTNHQKRSHKFYIEESTSSHGHCSDLSGNLPISNLDVLQAVYATLSMKVTNDEWKMLGDSDSRGQRHVTRAYERRCRTLGGEWDAGVKRVDWLGERTILSGVIVDKTARDVGVANLVFRKPYD